MLGNVIIINDQYCGGGDIGEALLGVFLRKVLASLEKPDTIIFYNSGVKLLTTKSDILTILVALQTLGVDIIACGMCVNGCCDNNPIQVGRVTSMDEIVSILMRAKKVITL